MRWVKLEHALDQVLEVITEEFKSVLLVLAMGLPEDVSSVSSDASVEWIRWLSSSEWWMLGNHDEQDNRSSKQINRFSVIGLFQMNFWSHVVQGTEFGEKVSRSISSFDWCCKSKICNFEVELGIKHEIFRFKIPMRNTFLMDVVKTRHEFFEIVSSEWFLESTRLSNKIEQFSTLGDFKSDVTNISCWFSLFLVFALTILV